jgi:hypothetical protein
MHRGTSPTDKESPWPYARSSARVDHLIESSARPSQDRSDVFLEEAAAARHFIQDRKNIGGSLDVPERKRRQPGLAMDDRAFAGHTFFLALCIAATVAFWL